MPEKKETYSIQYTNVQEKNNPLKDLAELVPKQLLPTKKTSYIFTTILLLIITIGLIKSLAPITDLSFDVKSGESKAFKLDIRIGLPYEFFISSTEAKNPVTFNIINLLIDLFIYLIISYILDVILNFIFSIQFRNSKIGSKEIPKEFKLKKRSMSERVTDSIAEKVAEKIAPKTTAVPQTPSP
ncbi:MAG: hypothetical protein ACI83O_000157 [Patescibacteria group bacterium]|jgi:hypothetical protein